MAMNRPCVHSWMITACFSSLRNTPDMFYAIKWVIKANQGQISIDRLNVSI